MLEISSNKEDSQNRHVISRGMYKDPYPLEKISLFEKFCGRIEVRSLDYMLAVDHLRLLNLTETTEKQSKRVSNF